MNQQQKLLDGSQISLADEDAVKQVVVDTVFGLWSIVNNLTRLRPSKHERYRVTVFGSARAAPQSFVYEQVRKISKGLAEMGCDIVTGGGPGLMQAANEGATEANAPDRSCSVGIRVELPFEQDVNSFVTQAYEHGTFFTRLHHFVLVSDAFVVAPGGIGTVLEAMMVWQLLQVRHLRNTPLIFAGQMWAGLVDWARESFLRADSPLANPEDLDIPVCVSTAEEVIDILRESHNMWIAEQKK